MEWNYSLLAVVLVLVTKFFDVGSAQGSPRTIVTPDFFNSLLAATPSWCKGKNFYSYDAFISAAEDGKFGGFGTTRGPIHRRRELAAFLANVMHETEGLCYKKERLGSRGSNIYCDPSKSLWPCAPGKKYFGRGPIQLTWNFNYGAAGQAIGFDGLNNPEIVGRDPTISFKTAVWFWMAKVHQGITTGGGFASTIRAINSGECNGRNPKRVASRVKYYQSFCKQFRVDPGQNLYC